MAILGPEHAFLKIEQGSQMHTDLVTAIDLLAGGVNGTADWEREDGCAWRRKSINKVGAIEWQFVHADGAVLGRVTYEVDKDVARARLQVALVCEVFVPETSGKKPACKARAHGDTLEEVLHNAEFYIRVKTAHYPCWQRPR